MSKENFAKKDYLASDATTECNGIITYLSIDTWSKITSKKGFLKNSYDETVSNYSYQSQAKIRI